MLKATSAAPFEEANATRPFRMRLIPTSRLAQLWMFLCSLVASLRGTGRAWEAPPKVHRRDLVPSDGDLAAGPDRETFVSGCVPRQQQAQSRVHHDGWLKKMFNRRQLAIDREYQQRKDEWAAKYTSVEGLRQTFGKSARGYWGDLDAESTRRLYKTLLPYVLLELYNMGVRAEDLAPLAYRARVAAKLYARERCFLVARVAASMYDGMRTWTKYGSFNSCGMTYQQVWNKYAAQVLEECRDEEGLGRDSMKDDVVTAKICQKILERSCATNEVIDRMVLSNGTDGVERQELKVIMNKLEQDVRELLQPPEIDRRGAALGGQRRNPRRGLFRMWRRRAAPDEDRDDADEDSGSVVHLEGESPPRPSAAQGSSPLGHLSSQSIKTLRSVVRIRKHLEALHPVVHARSFLDD